VGIEGGLLTSRVLADPRRTRHQHDLALTGGYSPRRLSNFVEPTRSVRRTAMRLTAQATAAVQS
jgi:hypothetical protein